MNSSRPATLRFGAEGQFELQAHERRLLVAGAPAELGARAFDLLLALVEAPGQLLTKNALMDRVWPGLVVVENNLAAQVSALRKVLGGELIATIPGRGYRFTGRLDTAPALAPGSESRRVMAQMEAQLGAEESSVVAIAQASAPPRLRTNLPESLEPLIGREKELADLGALVDAQRLVTLVGAGGMGKSRLAQALLHARRDAYKHGVCWVELATVPDADALPGAIAIALGVRPPTGEPIAGLAGALAPLHLLLALDGAEHLVADVAQLAQALLRQAPRLSLAVTSQAPLKLAAERVFRLEALAVPPASLPAAQALGFGAVALFAERAQAADVRFALTDAQVPAVVSLCEALDGLPLAIELAAARVPMFGVQRLAASMQNRLQLLTASRDRAASARHQTLRAALDWSHGLLEHREQAVFRRLAVFAGSASLAVIQRVVADAEPADGVLDEWAVLDALGVLVDRSLVTVLGADGELEPRYRLLDSPRAFAVEQLRAAGEEDALRRRHAQAFAEHFDAQWHARHAGDIGVEAWERQIDLDAANAGEAVHWAIRANETDWGLAIAATWLHAMHRSMHAERMALADTCEALAQVTDSKALRVRAALAMARAWTNPRKQRAFAAVDRALALARELVAETTDRWLLYRTLCQWVVSGSSLAETPSEALTAALAEMASIEDPAWPPHRLELGIEARSFFLSRNDAAPDAPAARLALSRRTAAIATAIRDDPSTSMNNLIDAELAAGDLQAAVLSGHALLAHLSGSRNENIMAFARLNLGASLLALGDIGRARPVLESSWEKAPAFELQPYCADYLALLAALGDRPRAAATLAGYADAGYRAKGEGREPNEAAAAVRVQVIAREALGNLVFEQLRAQGTGLIDGQVAAIAFGASDLG